MWIQWWYNCWARHIKSKEENFASGHETKLGYLKENLFINYFVITFCFCHAYCNDISILTVIHKAYKYCETILLCIWHLWLARVSLRLILTELTSYFELRSVKVRSLDWKTAVLPIVLFISLVLPSSECSTKIHMIEAFMVTV
jgi:hypothetical protein